MGHISIDLHFTMTLLPNSVTHIFTQGNVVGAGARPIIVGAAEKKNADMVDLLLEFNATPDAVDPSTGYVDVCTSMDIMGSRCGVFWE